MGWALFLEGKSWGMHLVQLGTKYRPVSTTLSPYHIYQKQLPLDCVFTFLEVGCLIEIWKPFIDDGVGIHGNYRLYCCFLFLIDYGQ